MNTPQEYKEGINKLKHVETKLNRWAGVFQSIVDVLQGKEKRVAGLQGPGFDRKFFFRAPEQPSFDYGEKLPTAEEIIDALDEKDRLNMQISSFKRQITEAERP